MTKSVVMFADKPGTLRVFAGNLQKNPYSAPRLKAGVGKGNHIGKMSPALVKFFLQAPPVCLPVSPAGNKRQHLPASQDIFAVPVQKRQYRSTGIIRPGRACQDNEIIFPAALCR